MMITLVWGVHIQVLVPPGQVVVVNVPRVLCAEFTADLLGQQGPGLGATKPPGSGLPGKWVGREVNGEPIDKKMHINIISIYWMANLRSLNLQYWPCLKKYVLPLSHCRAPSMSLGRPHSEMLLGYLSLRTCGFLKIFILRTLVVCFVIFEIKQK